MTAQQRLAYSIVRYYHDRLRDDPINVGVVVQTPDGVRVKSGPIEAIRRAYPFVDVAVLTENMRELTAMLVEAKSFEVFDYERNDRGEVATSDLRLLTAINNELPESVALTAPRFAELGAATAPGVQGSEEALLNYLLQTSSIRRSR